MKTLKRLAVLALSVGIALLASEVALRMFDGYRVASTLLERKAAGSPAQPGRPSERVRAYVRSLPVADGVSREWFDQSPDPLPNLPLSTEMAAVAEQIRPAGVPAADMFKLWNTRYVHERACENDQFFQRFPGFALSFEPVEPSIHPPYRFLPSFQAPSGLHTNRFGFRGHEITADKPAGVVRVAFVGASTTVAIHGQPFSYPEHIEPWLNLWAKTHAPGIRFETINAGREGFASADIAALVRQELAPLEPDLIVYHEGSNQFDLKDLIVEDGEPIPGAPPVNLRALPGRDRFDLVRRLDIALRRVALTAGAEPRKPKYKLRWPASVDEAHPDPDSPALPVRLPQIVHDLDDIRRTASTIGAKVALTSFFWLIQDGIVVDPVDNIGYLILMNQRLWPARYTDTKRLTEFQNRVFRAYADKRGVPFVDVASTFPRDLDLFTDAIHTSPDGDRLRAWLIFQGLIPVLQAEIAARRLPAADRAPYQVPPLPRSTPRISTECPTYAGFVPVPGAFPLPALEAVWAATVTGTGARHVTTPPGRDAYAAELPIAEWVRRGGAGVVRWRLRVGEGRVALGVLSADRSSFLIYRTVDASPDPHELLLPVDGLANAGFLVVANAMRSDGHRSVVDVDELTLLRRP